MPLRELDRMQAVNRFLKLEINRGQELQRIVQQAAAICKTPVALITLLDDQTQYIKFQVGFDRQQTASKDAFCRYTIDSDDIMEIPDAEKDERFSGNPLVTGDPHIRFYAGSPLTTQDGYNLGSLCVIDHTPRQLSADQRMMLEILSRQAMQILEFELSINVLKDQIIKVKQSETKLRSFFESMVSCHLLLGKDFEVLAFNRMVADFIQELFGVAIQEGDRITDFVHKSHLSTFEENYKAALAGATVTSEQEISYRDGRTIYWYMTYEPAYNQDREVIGVSYNATDITERIRQEQLVISQNQSLRRIAFIQSHELRRPVSSIMGISQLIQSEDIPSHIQEEVSMLQKAVAELDQKIREIVSYTT